ncbi:tyrosine-protein phosphatase [Pseudoxanthomonas dokdonensis]|uniref:Tyrosine protein phosphatase n=1 Tax=Pseudoxanthomonas dokdonensis TaxID=344882 RepID=A0A0R0CKP8_9GAMM|nr:tyrosine-protein phosphatase [Pseudoxanthomonas dokdonensis]KRG70585.1 tyrosine protein phosphatase [Pseudoxanthomonas dokdonensis]
MITHTSKLTQAISLTLALGLPLLGGCASAQLADKPATAPATTTAPSAATAVAANSSNVAPTADDAQRVMPLQGAWNVRTFAGLQGSHGPIPATAFVRTADLSGLTDADRDALAAAGVNLDIDLRTGDEETHSPDRLADDARFDYKRISLMGTEKMDLRQMMTSFPDSLGEAYVQWLSGNQAQFKQVFELIAAHDQGTVLFHCTAGKDRTGVISALLLDLAGVPASDIVHNYAISAHYLQDQPRDNAMMAEVMALMREHPEIASKMAGMNGTAPENMQMFLDALYQQYGDAAGYLKTIGLSDGDIQRLRVRLGQAG